MIRTRILGKIFITTLSMFILLTVFSIPTFQKSDVLRTNFEITNATLFSTNDIYLLNKENYLVRSRCYIEGRNDKEKIIQVLNNLINKKDNFFPDGLSGTLPNKTRILEVIVGDDIATINFSRDILSIDVSKEKQMITSIVYSVLGVSKVKGVMLLVEGEQLAEYPNTKEKIGIILDKKIGINNSYLFNSRNDISKVVVYYVSNINNENYYVPVTKYVNDSREKIEIVVEELTSNYIYEDNLMSLLDSRVELIDYREEGEVLFLNFNDYLLGNDDKLLEEVSYTIALSSFDNYDVNMVMFEVNGKEIKYISRGEI